MSLYAQWMESLKSTNHVVVSNHLETVIKPIPDSDRTGDLDPRV